MKPVIKVGFLISYDYEFLYTAIERVYEYADEILLAIDIERLTWSGEPFDLPQDFFIKVSEIDVAGKVIIFEDKFYVGKSPMENETRERNLLSAKMGENCWKLQIDSDEYFLDFEGVYSFLNRHWYFLSNPEDNAINLRGVWVTLFKKTANGFLYIDDKEHFSFGTNVVGQHYFARDLSTRNNRELMTNFAAVHQSWARTPEQVWQKISNWGHKNDFDTKKYFDFWMSVDEYNYHNFVDLHPFDAKQWKSLKFIECESVTGFIERYNQINKPTYTFVPVKYFKKYIKKIFKSYFK